MRRSELRIRALVLAAGQGQRLRPLTGFIPKPLLPVVGRPVVEYTLERLQKVGCKAVALNLHHLGDAVSGTLGTDWQGLEISYSPESELLGTLGAFGPLRSFFGEADLILLVNGDSLCRWPLRALLRRHLRAGADATLLVSRRADAATFGGGIGIDKEGNVVDLRKDGRKNRARQVAERRVFAGAHVLSPSLLDRLPQRLEPADIISDLYEPLLEERRSVVTCSTAARWHDLGTPRRYLSAVLDWARGRGPLRTIRSRWISRGARVAKDAKVLRSVVESGARVEAGAVVDESVVLSGSTVGAGCRLRSVVVAPEVDLPAESGVEARLVTPLRAGRDPGASDSVVGRLVFTPIDRSL